MARQRGVLGLVTAVAFSVLVLNPSAAQAGEGQTLTLTTRSPALLASGVAIEIAAHMSQAGDGSVVLRDAGNVVGDPVSTSSDQPTVVFVTPVLGLGTHTFSAEFTPLDSAQPHAQGKLAQVFVADASLTLPPAAPASSPLVVTLPTSCAANAAHVQVDVDGVTAEGFDPSGSSYTLSSRVADLGLIAGPHIAIASCRDADGQILSAFKSSFIVTDDGPHGWWESVDEAPVAPVLSLQSNAVAKGAVRVDAVVTPAVPGSLVISDGLGVLASRAVTSSVDTLELTSSKLARGRHSLIARFTPTDHVNVMAVSSEPLGLGAAQGIAFAPKGHLSAPLAIALNPGCEPDARIATATVTSKIAGWKAVSFRPRRATLARSGLVIAGGLPALAAAGAPVVAGRYDLTVSCGAHHVVRGSIWVTDPSPIHGWWESVNRYPVHTTTTASLVSTSGRTAQLQVQVTPPVGGALVVSDGTQVVARRVITAPAARGLTNLAIRTSDVPGGHELIVAFRPTDVVGSVVSNSAALAVPSGPSTGDLPPLLPPVVTSPLAPPPQIAPPPASTADDGLVPEGLSISTPYTSDQPLDLGALVLNSRGDAFVGRADFSGISVSDGRAPQSDWTLVMSSSDLTSDQDVIPADDVVFTDVTVSNCTSPCPPDATTGSSYVAVKGSGSSDVKGALQVVAPTSATVGSYGGTLTLTVT